MRKSAADKAFARYRAKGEPTALARVFDLLAPDLLLVAAHFARDEAEAEDLVQTTFLEAIESAARFDPARPLRPWLIGILVNRVRRAKEKDKRVLDPQRLRMPRQVDPVALAEQKELGEAFDRALTDLPEHHQQVLRLHLVHGFTSGQIAMSLGHPPATVRTWIKRGKEVLRRVLPAGLAGAVLGSVYSSRGLAAVREVVLSKAGSVVPHVLAVGVVAEVLIMKKLAIVASTLAVLGAIWLALSFPGSGVGGDESGVTGAGALAGSEDGVDPAVESGTSRTQLVSPAGPAAQLLTVRGQVLAAETREPLPGCKVRLQGHKPKGDPYPSWSDPEPIYTDGAGRFQFKVALPHTYSLSICAGGESRVQKSRWWPEPWKDESHVLEAGVVRLSRGVRLRARVLDERRCPVQGARVFLADLEKNKAHDPGWGERHPSGSGEWTASDGRVEFPSLVRCGTWEVSVTQAPPLVGSHDVVVRPGLEEVQLLVEHVPPEDTIAGIVTDASGSPLRGLNVDSFPHTTRWWTGADGRFKIFRRRQEDPEGVYIRIYSVKWKPYRSPVRVPWGTREHRIMLQPLEGVWIQVIEASTGAPVERFSIKLVPSSGSGSKYKKCLGGEHEQGNLFFPHVGQGSQIVAVFPERKDLLPSMPLVFESPRDSQEPLRIKLHRAEEFTVEVTFSDGKPVPGSRVCLVDPCGARPNPYFPPIDELHSFHEWTSSGPICLARGETDGQGRANLRWFASSSRLSAYVVGPEHVPLVVPGIVLRKGQFALRVTVHRGGRITGRLFPNERLKKLLGCPSPGNRKVPSDAPEYVHASRKTGLLLKEVVSFAGGTRTGGHRQVPATYMDCVEVGENGSFEIGGIPEGSWGLYMKSSLDGRIPFRRPSPLVTFRLGPGETRRFEIDLRDHFAPARISGRILHNGRPLASAKLLISFGVALPDGTVADYSTGPKGSTDGEGRFDLQELRPQHYAIKVRLGNGEHEVTYPVMTWRHLPSTSQIQEDFQIRTFSVRCRLLSADGKTPVAKQQLSIVKEGSQGMGIEFTATTGADGRVHFKYVPSSFDVRVRVPGRPSVRLGSYTLTGNEQEITLHMPAASR